MSTRIYVLERRHSDRRHWLAPDRPLYYPVECYTSRAACSREASRRNETASHYSYRCRPTSLPLRN